MRIALPLILAVLLSAAFAASAAAAPDPVLGSIQRAEAGGALPAPQGALYRQVLTRARTVRAGLRGVRRREMAAVLTIAGRIARRGDLTAARMPAVFLTLERNAEWWGRERAARSGIAGRGRRPRTAVQAPPRAGARGARVVPGQRTGLPVLPRARAAAADERHVGQGERAVRKRRPGPDRARRGASERAAPARGRAVRRPRVGVPLPDLRRAAAVDQRAVAGDGRAGPHARGGDARAPRPAEHRRRRGRGVRVPAAGGRPRSRSVTARCGSRCTASPRACASSTPTSTRSRRCSTSRRPRATRTRRPPTTPACSPRTGGSAASTRACGRGTRTPGALADLNYHVLNTTLAGEVCKRSGDARICGAAGSFARELERRCPRVDAIEEARDAL